MFGQSGRGVGAWQGQSNNNMDPETLAQTLVSVAQNLLSSQSQNANHSTNNSGSQSGGRPSPWANANNFPAQNRDQSSRNGDQQFRGHDQHKYGTQNSNNPNSLMGMGLLGAPPDGDYRTVREPVFVIRDQESREDQGRGHSGGGHDGFEEDRCSEGVISRSQSFDTDKSRKNYRQKIKEDGCPPKYAVEEFDHLKSQYFCCAMCGKNMWNSLSFVNHIKGNAHNKVVENATSKESSKVADIRKQITELANKENLRPKPGDKPGKCNMCGVKVKGDMIAHRKTDYHQKLKMFIHPHCKVCDADFEDRGEWHYHRFSAEHLSSLNNSREGLEYDPMSLEELDKLLKQLEKRNGLGNNVGFKLGGNSAHNVEKNNMFKQIKAAATKQSQRTKESVDDDIIIVEDDVTEKDLEPLMQDGDILGAEFIKPVNGLFCKLCKKFFGSGDLAITEHCQTQYHLKQYRAQAGNTSQPGKRSSAAEFFNPKRKK